MAGAFLGDSRINPKAPAATNEKNPHLGEPGEVPVGEPGPWPILELCHFGRKSTGRLRPFGNTHVGNQF